jgi:hypothetical protein
MRRSFIPNTVDETLGPILATWNSSIPLLQESQRDAEEFSPGQVRRICEPVLGSNEK